MSLLEAIARDLHRPTEQLRLPADLLRQGYDPSYLARVRPDELNQLDSIDLAKLRRALRRQEQLEAFKATTLEDGKKHGWWTEELATRIGDASTKAEVQALTRNASTRRGSLTQAAANPAAEKISAAILMYSGPAPEDFRTWVAQQAGIEESGVDALLADVQNYLQALLLEDASLVAKIFSYIRERAVVESNLNESPTDKALNADAKPSKNRNRRKPKKSGTPEKQPAVLAQLSTSTTSSSDPTAGDVENVSSNESATSESSQAPIDVAVAQTVDSSGEDAQPASSQEQQSQEQENETENEVSAETPTDVVTDQQSVSTSPIEVESSPNTQAEPVAEVSATGDAAETDKPSAPEIANFDDQRGKKKTRAVSAKELTPRQRRRRWLKIQLEPYNKLRRSLQKLTPYQIVMLGRGNRSQILKVRLDYDRNPVQKMARQSLTNGAHPMAEFLEQAVEKAVNGLLTSRIEQEVFASAEEEAQQQLVEFAVEHLQTLLMQRPIRGQRIMSIDAIGAKTAAVVIVDPEGRIDFIGELNCNSTRPDAVNHNVKLLGEWVHRYNVSLLALSTGPARRYLMHSVREFMNQSDENTIRWTMVDRDGADTYCTTRLALQELPTVSRRHRAAAWLAWRLQDPLNELLKVEPTRLRLAVFQAELPPELVEQSLHEAVAASVAACGIDYWNAHREAIACIPGLDSKIAAEICKIRDGDGPSSREELSAVLADKLPERQLRQAIGFLRIYNSSQPLDATLIHPDDYRLAERLIANTELTEPTGAPAGWTKEAPLPEPVVTQNTPIATIYSAQNNPAPESFGDGLNQDHSAGEMADATETTVDGGADAEAEASDSVEANASIESEADLAPVELADESNDSSEEATSPEEATTAGESEFVSAELNTTETEATGDAASDSLTVRTFGGHELMKVTPNFTFESAEAFKVTVDAEKLARSWQVGREKLRFVARVLQHPYADPRELSTPIPLMSRVPKIEDLQPGETHFAIVSGIADFGVFADLGPDCSGLIHVSRLSRSHVDDPHQVVNVGDLIQVWVIEIDASNRRVSLSALPPGVYQESRPASEGSERGQGGNRYNDRRGSNSGNDRRDNQAARPERSQGQFSRPNERQGSGSGPGERAGQSNRDRFVRSDAGGSSNNDGNRGRSNDRGSGDRQSKDRAAGGRFGSGGGQRDRGRGGRRGGPNSGVATVFDLPSKDNPAIARKGNAGADDPETTTGKEPMRSFSDLLARFQTKNDESKKQPPSE